jgi:hypothetical protein
MKGSYEEWATIGEVHGLIEKAFEDGADCRMFEASPHRQAQHGKLN